MRRSSELHVWPALTDLMGGITLVVMFVLVQGMMLAGVEHQRLKEAEQEARRAEKAARAAAELESHRSGVKRELLEELRQRLVKEDVHVDISPAGTLEIPSDFLFDSGSHRVRPEGLEQVKQLGRAIGGLLLSERAANVRSVLVVGHTDDVGNAESNLELSLWRALELTEIWNRSLFGGKDPTPETQCATKKLMPSGMGELAPRVVSIDDCANRPGETKGCRANRRVEIQIIPIEGDDADPCTLRGTVPRQITDEPKAPTEPEAVAGDPPQ